MARRNRFSIAGICLAETMVGLLIGSTVIATAWSLIGTAMRGGRRTDAALTGVEAVMSLAVSLERDLRCLYEDDSHSLTVTRGSNGLVVAFHRSRPTADGALEAVRYEFDERTGRVSRAVGDDKHRSLRGTFRTVDIRTTGDGSVEFGCTAKVRDRTGGMNVRGGANRSREVVRSAYPFWNEIPYTPAGA